MTAFTKSRYFLSKAYASLGGNSSVTEVVAQVHLRRNAAFVMHVGGIIRGRTGFAIELNIFASCG